MTSYLESSNGVRQGCGLGALLFALSVKGIYEETLAEVPGVKAVAIMDDLFLMGRAEDVLLAYEKFTSLCERDGSLAVNHKKWKFMSLLGEELSGEVLEKIGILKLKVHTKVAKVLGAPIGSADEEV